MRSWLLLALVLPSLARAEAPVLHVPVERFVLPNGLVVLLHEDHRAPTVALDIWWRVGSKDERAGRSGFAHLFEHLMFMGTRAVPTGEFDAVMEAHGGMNNASTSEDRTNYFETGPANLLETFLWLEADRIATLPDAMTRAKLDLQREVVKNERRQSIENRPYGRVELVLPEHLFPDGHPYHHPVIGSHEDLTAASVDDVKDFFRRYYVASNATLVLVGDFRSAEARALVEKYLGPLPTRPLPEHAEFETNAPARDESVELDDDVALARVTLAWVSPAEWATGDAACDLLAAVLGNGKSSRLWRSLVYEKKLAGTVEVGQNALKFGGELTITATAQPGHSAKELEAAIGEELGALAGARPVTAAELGRARALVETTQIRALEHPVALADAIADVELRFHDPAELERRYLGQFEAVTVDEINAVARTVLGRPRIAVRVSPRKPAGARP